MAEEFDSLFQALGSWGGAKTEPGKNEGVLPNFFSLALLFFSPNYRERA